MSANQRAFFTPSFVWAIATLLALLHAWWGLTATIDECAAYDEIAYVVAGHAYWHDRDFRLQPENGVLAQRLIAIPTLLVPWHMPPPNDPAWRDSDVWDIGTQAFYHLGNNTDFVLFLARAVASLNSVALMLLIFGWSSRLFGYAGGFTSIALFAFCPNFLGHGALVTSDVTAAFWLTASTGAYWWFVHQPSWTRTLVSGLCVGFAAVAKYSVVLLGPVWLILLLVRLFSARSLTFGRHTDLQRARAAGLLVRATLAQVALALAVIWTFYGWRAEAFNPAIPGTNYFHPWSQVLNALGPRARLFVWLRKSHLVPDAYAYGLSNVIAFSQHRAAFLNGVVSNTGWVKFFPYAFLVKTPLPLFAGLSVTLVLWIKSWRTRGPASRRSLFYRLTPLAVLFVVYWAASLTSHLNIGIRHLLPVYPPLFIVAGAAGQALWTNPRLGRASLAVLLGWSAIDSWLIRPNYLAFFNALSGGPSHGYRHLVDSSLDWGQDLPRLAVWLRQHARHDESITLSYFGMGDPVYEGIVARPLPCQPIRQAPIPNTLQPGWYIVSATMLQQTYSPIARTWTVQSERSFQSLRLLEVIANAWEKGTPEVRGIKIQYQHNIVLQRDWRSYELLRFARLCEYLRARKPDAEIGYSLLAYRLSEHDLQSAVYGSVSDLAQLIDDAAITHAPD